MRFLVFGCNGMAGHMISLYLKENGHSVLGFDRSSSHLVDSIVGDACDIKSVKSAIFTYNPDTIINCIGVLNKSADANKPIAVYLNALFPHLLAEITKDTDIQIIHMSTDCVFSGKRGQYTETELCDGETFYDRTKALGELNDEKNMTLRNSIVGPDINSSGIGLLNWFMQQSDAVKGYARAIWTGQTTLQLAKTMEEVARRRACGLVNAVPNKSISKYDLLQLFNRYLRLDKIDIEKDESFSVDKSLIRTHFEFDYIIPDYDIMVKELADWMKDHRSLYPHYKIAV